MKGRLYLIIISLIILFSNLPVHSQSYNIINYTVKNGLPSGIAFSTTQDTSGRMWFASNQGVLEFDNIAWKLHVIYEERNTTTDLRWLLSDKKGKVFVFNRSISEGGYYYQNKIWTNIKGPEKTDESIEITGTAIVERNGNSTLAFGTYNNGVYLYDSGKWRHITKRSGLLDNDIISIDSFDNEFYALSKKGISIVSNELINNALNKILPDNGEGLTGIKISRINNKRTIWLTGTDWIGKIEDSKFTKIKDLDDKINKNYGHYLSFRKTIIEYDRRGILFYGNINALFFLDLNNKKTKEIDSDNGLTTRGVTSILQDRELNVWACTLRGINKIVSLQFENYSMKNGLLENEVCSIAEISPGIMVFGHNNGITIKEEDKYKKIQLNKFLKNNVITSRVYDILVDSKKRMWIAAGYGGLFLFDTSQDYNLINHWEANTDREFITLSEDKHNKIWVAGNHGIWKVIDNKLKTVNKEGLLLRSTRKMLITDKNQLYFASMLKGIFSLKDNKWERYYSKTNKSFNSTYAACKYKDDSLLIGSAGGLLELKHKNLQLFSEFGWKIDEPVYFITRDKQENYWIGTKNGVFMFNNKSHNRFTYLDGLVGVETNRGGGFVDSSGHVWIGMDQGVSKYTPDLYDIPYYLPIIKINKVRVNNIEQNISDRITISGNNIIEFFTDGVSFIGTNPLKFWYKLNGFDKHWVPEDIGNGYIRYDNLPVGKYTFMAKATTERGLESDIHFINNIIITKPFYFTYWFVLIILFSLLLSSLLFRKLYNNFKVSQLLKKEIYRKNIQLKESLLSYQSLFEESLDCIFTSTPDGMFLSINPAGLDLFGYKNIKEISKYNIRRDIYIDLNRRDEFEVFINNKGHVKNFESKVKKKDGTILTVIESTYLIKNNRGEIIGYRGIIRDITDQQRLQTQLVQAQKMESIGLLAGGIAHDFNNILSGILGYANLLKRQLAEDKKLSRYINTIEKSAERATDLTKKLLGFARKGKYKVTLIDINEIIQEVSNLLTPIIDRSINIEQDLINPSVLIEADASQIQQVIMNICLNARDALPNGGIISISTMPFYLSTNDQMSFPLTAEEGKYLRISIEDNGFGIKQEDIQKIFDPFFTTKKTSKGSGLGLSMVYGVLKNHNGALNVESIDKEGTTFDLYFPVNPKNKHHFELKTNESTGSTDMLELLSGNETILVVDDEEIHRQLLVNILNDSGYTAIEAVDGMDSIYKFSEKTNEIDLVILDMSMPNMGGNETFTELRKINQKIKVLINSGYSRDDKIQTILDHSGTDFIQKPFKPRHLLLKIRALLQ